LNRGDIGGLIYDSDGRSIRQPFLGKSFVPTEVSVEGEGDAAVVRYWFRLGRVALADTAPDVLPRFVGLAQADTRAILAFARTHGVLGLCKHGRPAVHREDCMGMFAESESYEEPTEWQAEPLTHWRRYATVAGEMVRMSSMIHKGEFVDNNLGGLAARDSLPIFELSFDFKSPHEALEHMVNVWLDEGVVRPTFEWSKEGGRPRVILAGFGLFGAIGVELLFRCAGAANMEFCTGCGKMYLREKRRPRVGQDNYCLDCGRKAAVREAKRRFDRSKRQKNEA